MNPAEAERLKGLAGPGGFLDQAEDMRPYLEERRRRYRSEAALVLRPNSVAGLRRLVRHCHDAGIAMVPQGGNTGLCGGAVAGRDEVIVSTDRLSRIRDVDPLDNTLIAEAGAILQTIQEAAEAVDRLFPLSLGAEGSCRIGGNISTNAGGTGVLRYGTMRHLVLGLEVVLPDGSLWDGLRTLRKDNTGYDLKHLFIGAEGTLGIVTAAALRLFPRPKQVETCLLSLATPRCALDLLALAGELAGDVVSAMELMPATLTDMAVTHIEGASVPLETRRDWVLLMELGSSGRRMPLRRLLDEVLEAGFESGLIADGVIAESGDQRRRLWFLREAIIEAQKSEGASIKHDIAVPVSRIPDLITQGMAAAIDLVPGCRPVPFGHVGDGNIHFNISRPVGAEDTAFLAHYGAMNRRIHDIAVDLGGTISAEHGIGLTKVTELAQRRSPTEMDLQRRIKTMLDPTGVLNPGKVILPGPLDRPTGGRT